MLRLVGSLGLLLVLSATCLGQGPGRRPFDVQSRMQRFEDLIRQLDQNGNGTIEPNEVPRERRFIFERLARRVGFDPQGPVAVGSLREATARYYGDRERGRTEGGSAPRPASSPPPTSPPGSTSPPAPVVLGYSGPANTGITVPGFGLAAMATLGNIPKTAASGAATPPPTVSPPSGASSPPPPAADEARQRRYRHFAESIIRQHDQNKNGLLEKDEWTTTRPDLKSADQNSDGALTQDEVAAWLVNYSQRGPNTVTPTSEEAKTATARRFYRVLTPHERLPQGLPDWFTQKDADADGQVTMAEFSRIWADRLVAEFVRHDLNNDGLITASECLQASAPASAKGWSR